MTAPIHRIFGRPLDAPVPAGMEQIIFGMGCYWGVERLFWQEDGIWLTEVGFAGGHTDAPDYHQVCTGQTGHAEVVRLIFDPSRISLERLLQMFWENHDPTQGNRQWNDIGTQYRSMIMYFSDHQRTAIEASRVDYNNRLAVQGKGKITTQVVPAERFWLAQDDHQQYLDRHPDGYCNLHGTGVPASLREGHENK